MMAAVVAASCGAAYAAGRHFSPGIVAYVVQEALVQKAPSGSDPAEIRRRFQALAAEYREPGARLEKLLAISLRLEKLQVLETGELERLLRGTGP
jgi:hypothetical protein